MDDVTPEMKRLLNYIDGQAASDDFTRELETAVKSVRSNEKWRIDYMTLEMHYQEKYEEGVEDGRSEGIAQAISNTISILRRNNFSDDKIISELTTDFGISTEEAEKIVLNKA